MRMTKEQQEACEALAEKYCGSATRKFVDMNDIPSYAASPVYNENKAYQAGFQAAQTPEMLMLNPLVKGLVEALREYEPDNKWEQFISGGNIFGYQEGDFIWAFDTENPNGLTKQALAPFKEVEK